MRRRTWVDEFHEWSGDMGDYLGMWAAVAVCFIVIFPAALMLAVRQKVRGY